MKSSFCAYLFSILLAGLLLAGCSQENKGSTDMRERIDTELGVVEKVTVMSTDGQEVTLDLPQFLKELPEQGKDLQTSLEPLKQEDVRFTLVIYRKKLAPLVVSVGETASQYGESTYRGGGAVGFYQWILRQTGRGLLSQRMENVLLSAEDLSRTRALGKAETAYIQSVLEGSVAEMEKSSKQYPLHPYYRLRIDGAVRPLEVTVLTPTLISVPFGRETLFFHVQGKLFSKLTEWLPPKDVEDDLIESLFKSSRIRLEAAGGTAIQDAELTVTDTTVEQGIGHQVVRLLKTGSLLKIVPQQPGQEQFRLHFLVNGQERTFHFYPHYFRVESAWYAHDRLDQTIWKMLAPPKK